MSITFFVAPLWATTLSITVPAGEQVDQIMDLKADDHVSIQFNVLGADNSYISFSLMCPNSTEVNFGEVGLFSYDFICDEKGEYVMSFVNNDLAENMFVTLNYEVVSYIFGMPQTQFLVIFIAVVCVLMVAFYTLLSPHP
ncbi:hypothetical protein KJN74_04725 [Candidatus Bathyarchaeota archaeon]|nr:hypothetical protein [Candidatus Bathyarchaeota archaeon]